MGLIRPEQPIWTSCDANLRLEIQNTASSIGTAASSMYHYRNLARIMVIGHLSLSCPMYCSFVYLSLDHDWWLLTAPAIYMHESCFRKYDHPKRLPAHSFTVSNDNQPSRGNMVLPNLYREVLRAVRSFIVLPWQWWMIELYSRLTRSDGFWTRPASSAPFYQP
jgi:hypothetical protein